MQTRRNVIAFSGKAIVAAAVLPLLATAALARDDTELYGYYRRYLKSEDPEQLEWFYRTPAHTTDGLILKLTGFWTQAMHREWDIGGWGAKVDFSPEATSAVLMDLEVWAGRRS